MPFFRNQTFPLLLYLLSFFKITNLLTNHQSTQYTRTDAHTRDCSEKLLRIFDAQFRRNARAAKLRFIRTKSKWKCQFLGPTRRSRSSGPVVTSLARIFRLLPCGTPFFPRDLCISPGGNFAGRVAVRLNFPLHDSLFGRAARARPNSAKN